MTPLSNEVDDAIKRKKQLPVNTSLGTCVASNHVTISSLHLSLSSHRWTATKGRLPLNY